MGLLHRGRVLSSCSLARMCTEKSRALHSCRGGEDVGEEGNQDRYLTTMPRRSNPWTTASIDQASVLSSLPISLSSPS